MKSVLIYFSRFALAFLFLISTPNAPLCEPPFNSISIAKGKVSGVATSDLSELQAAIDTSFVIEAVWIGTPQWMGGVDNGYEAFNGSIAKGKSFFGGNLTPSEYVPVELRFDVDSTNWSKVQVFRRDNSYKSAGVGKFPGSAWDISNSANPRRLNLLITEYDDGTDPIPPPNFRWDPDTSAQGKYEYLFVMRSSYDGTGLTYADSNVLQDDMDNLYAWWPRVAEGHTFFETSTASLRIFPKIGLHPLPLDTMVELSWTYPGPNPHHFKIFYALDSLANSFLVELPGTSTSFTHTGLIIGQEYFYKIKSYDAQNNEIYSSPVVRAKTKLITLNISLYGHWNQRTSYGDLWGYTDSLTGKEYALICSRYQGLSIVDINDTPLVEVGFVTGSFSGSDVKEVKTYGHYAVIVCETAPTQIADISDVTHPQVISTIPGGRHENLVDGHYLYLVGGSAANLGIYSLVDPYNPTYITSYGPYYYHDVAIRHDTLAACAIYGQGVDMIDLTTKETPTLIGHFNYPGSGAHNAAFSEDGHYLFIGDEIGQGNWTRVFDISDLSNITKVSDIIVNPFTIVHNSFVKGEHLYIAHYAEGLRVWNIANPLEPYEVAFYDTHPQPVTGYNGAWGVYPYFTSGKIIVSDMENGLFVFESELLPGGCCVGRRGDVNGDGKSGSDVLDLTFLINAIFRGGPEPSCDYEADIDADGTPSTVLDMTYLINNIFRGGASIPFCQ